MESCRNVVLGFVLGEACKQLQRLGEGVREKYYLNEVVAYAMNRLPPMFAATDKDHANKRTLCLQLQPQITTQVRRALMEVHRHYNRTPDQLEQTELFTPQRALLQTQELLGWQNLVWRDVPRALLESLEDNLKYYRQGPVALHPSVPCRNLVINRSGAKRSFLPEKLQYEFQSYMLETSLDLSHALERLVIRLAQSHAARLFPPAELQALRLEDLVAEVLNRVPPMYATTNRGIRHWRQYAQLNIGSQLMVFIDEALRKAHEQSKQQQPLVLFNRVRQERQHSLMEISQLLMGQDVRWQNLITAVDASLKQSKGGQTCWQKKEEDTTVTFSAMASEVNRKRLAHNKYIHPNTM
ncbi:MAG: late competence development ComFB family protein [Pseudanabaena sp. ELA607]